MSTAVASKIAYEEIDSRGFLLIRSFLTEDEIAMLTEDYQAAGLEVNANYSVRRISSPALANLEEKLTAVNEQIAAASSAQVDCCNDGVYFATFSEKSTLVRLRPGPQAFPWHQDHENYWMWSDTRNYLNFYMPIDKPVPEKSNLAVLPFDRLQQRAPDIYPQLLSRGATRLLPSGKRWIVKDDDRGGKLGTLNFDPSEIEECPHLRPGDLLLLRGDTVHRTQDSSTRRIAASVRYINSQTPVRLRTMAQGGLAKLVMMMNARYLFEPALRLFEQHRETVLPAGEIDAHLKTIRDQRRRGQASENAGRLDFLRRLARAKRSR